MYPNDHTGPNWVSLWTRHNEEEESHAEANKKTMEKCEKRMCMRFAHCARILLTSVNREIVIKWNMHHNFMFESYREIKEIASTNVAAN